TATLPGRRAARGKSRSSALLGRPKDPSLTPAIAFLGKVFLPKEIHFGQVDDFVAPTAGRMPQLMERMIDSGLDSLLDTVVDGCTKGFPQRAPPLRLGDVGSQGWNLPAGDLDTPVAVLKGSALDANIAWMSEFLRRAGASLCPHGKTTMAPQL